MKVLLDALAGSEDFSELSRAIEKGKSPAAVSGLGSIHKAHIAAALGQTLDRPLFLLCPDELGAARTARDIADFTGEEPVILPPREFIFHSAESVSREWEHQRLGVLFGMEKNRVTVASFEAAAMYTLPKELLSGITVTLKPGDNAELDALTDALLLSGYKRAAQVEGIGQFSARGGIVDVFAPGEQDPYRIEFFGDEVDTVSYFSVTTQRRTEQCSEAKILPAGETLPFCAPGGIGGLLGQMEKLCGKPNAKITKTIRADIEKLENGLSFPAADRYLGLIYPKPGTALDYLPEDALIVVIDHGRVGERSKNYSWQLEQDVETMLENGTLHPSIAKFALSLGEMFEGLSNRPMVYLDTFIGSSYELPPKALISFTAKQLPSYGGSLETAIEDTRHYVNAGSATVLLAANELRAKQLFELLQENGIKSLLDIKLTSLPPHGCCAVAVGGISGGFEYPELRLAVITEGQPVVQTRKKTRKRSPREKISSYTDLTPGDVVVHEHHGIARFSGVVTMQHDGVSRDYIKLAFKGTDILYLPVTQLDLVSKFIGGGGEDAPAPLSKLGGTDWQRSKSRAKAAARELAKELIQLYAERRRKPGYAFPPDNEWQREFEQEFIYDETEDQLRATAEIKSDMEAEFPMDRLLCGDVGFGKTEVALRAAMKCILAGKQAALLVPTTVLAQQHYLTATRRFTGFPVNVDVLSRFRSPKQHKETIARVARGSVDLLIGTHRIIQKDVAFKDLGLLIIDEEQRFGVSHKERLKEISRTVDVLSLSATPIPRTLNMALSGIRDMSTLEEAPRDRHPVQTYVLEHDWGVVFDAIRREVGRGGQVYYLHNRVESIDAAALRLSREFEGVSIAVAHGKMQESDLSEVMSRMEAGEVSILVCTTIIETGIDIPNVNTLIIEDADKLGLSQLHQIRGRVGRSQRHAYAYLTYRKGKILTEVAEKRLNAVREFAEFGAGFKIAMRDLEIRGAGNLLGHAQSGHMMTVGYTMYLKLLEEAVLEERGEKPKEVECTADISVSAGIPDIYIQDAGQRMDLYRRIALVRTEEDASDLIDELCDRYGDIPSSVHTLIRIARLRADAGELGINEISQRQNQLRFFMKAPDIRAVSILCGQKRFFGKLFFSAGDKPYLSLVLDEGSNPLKEAEKLITALAEAAAEGEA